MESRIHREVYVRFGGEYLKPTLEIMQGVGYLAYLIMLITILVNATNLTKNLTTKLGIKVMNYVKKISFQSLMNIMKVTKENIKLLVNLGMSLTKVRKEILGSLNCNLT